jgi:hypothetical protein
VAALAAGQLVVAAREIDVTFRLPRMFVKV